MAKIVLTNVRTFAGATDLTGVTNKATIEPKSEAVDVTNYGSGGWTELLGGLAESDIAVAGFFESGADVSFADPGVFANLATVAPWSLAPDGAADGALAYLTTAVENKYSLLGEVGKAAPFQATAKGCTKVARGVVAHPPGTARVANGTGTSNQIGALSASQSLYVNLHVLSVSATVSPSLTVRIESDNATGFPSPATVGTFTASTALSSQSMRIAGAVTDDWFRAAWTISGASASFLFLVTFGRA